MDFDPTLLRAFVAVREAGGFTRAAERLHLTQSAVSHQIRRLEEQVGRPLLLRTTRKLVLTEDGEDFLRHAEQILQAQDALTRRFQPSGVSGVVRLGVPEYFMGDRLPQLLRRFARTFPAVRLEVSVSVCLDLKAKIEEGELDLAVVMAKIGEVRGTALRRAQYVWVAADGFDLPPGASLPVAMSPPPCPCRSVAIEALGQAGIEWHTGFTSANQHGLHAAVLAGLAVTNITREVLMPGMRVIDGEYGLPPLPEVEFVLIASTGSKTVCACELGRLIVEGAEAPAPLLARAS